MSDNKRIQLTTINDVKNSSDPTNLSPSFRSTFRLEIELFEPNADSFPEFNYSKLLHAEKKKRKKVSKTNGFSDDPFEGNDDDVQRIAKEFERKYGGANNYVKKTSRPTLDCNDKGAGYDDNDSFIDNTEAYDEIIPDEIETAGGGFYINSGALEFKHLSNYERPEDALKMPKPKKRILSTSSESSEDDEAGVEETDSTNTGIHKQKNNGHIEKKQKVVSSDDQKNPKILKQSKSLSNDIASIVSVKEKKIEKPKKDKRIGDEATNSDSSKEHDKLIKTTTVKDMLRAKRDSLLSLKEGGVKLDGLGCDERDVMEVDKDSSTSSEFCDSSEDGTNHSDIVEVITEKSTNGPTEIVQYQSVQDIKLPNNLPEELIKGINLLKESCTTNIGKSNFFDTKTLEILLKVELQSRLCGSSIRNQIYSYLEVYLPCTKQTLLTRAKKLRIQQEEIKLLNVFNKFKSNFDEIMPNILNNYHMECKKITELRTNLGNDNKISSDPITEQQLKMPRKKFQWNENLRMLLYELYTLRKSFYNIIKPRKETLNEYLDNYLKTIVEVWPQGWMKIEDLIKEIDKRKPGGKKPKENKKPNEPIINSPSTTSNKEKVIIITSNSIDTVNSQIVKQQKKENATKTILSSNNNSTVKQIEKMTNQNSNVKINDKTEQQQQYSNVKKGNSSENAVSEKGRGLKITPVSSSGIVNKTFPSSVKNKVTNIDTTTIKTNTSTTLLTDDTSTAPIKLKQSINSNLNNKLQQPQTSSNKIQSSLSISVSSSHPSSGNCNDNNKTQLSPPSSKLLPTTTTTAGTTSTIATNKHERKTSDYSINSIMSSSSTPTSPILLSINNIDLTSPPSSSTSKLQQKQTHHQKQHSNSLKSTKTSSSHKIINSLDVNCKTISKNKLINLNEGGSIKVRSVANMNSSITKNNNTIVKLKNQDNKTKIKCNNNSDSDDVEDEDDEDDDEDDDDDEAEDDEDEEDEDNNNEENNNKTEEDVDEIDNINDDFSDSSDCVEIVGVEFQQQQPQQKSKSIGKTITVNRIKYINFETPGGSSSSNYLTQLIPTSSSSSLLSTQQQKQITTSSSSVNDDNTRKSLHNNLNINQQNQKYKKSDDCINYNNKNISASDTPILSTDNDIDVNVNQIMKELKELQELQQTNYSTNVNNLETILNKSHSSTGRKEHTDTNKFTSLPL